MAFRLRAYTPAQLAGLRVRRKRRGHGWTHKKRHKRDPLGPRYLCDRHYYPARQYLTVTTNRSHIWTDYTEILLLAARDAFWTTNMALVDQWVDQGRPNPFLDFARAHGFDIETDF